MRNYILIPLLSASLYGCGSSSSSNASAPVFEYADKCTANADYIYKTKDEPEADRAAKYAEITSYSTTAGETERNKSETGAYSVNVTWSNEMLSASDTSKNTVTIEFLDKDGNAPQSVSFAKENNPLLFMMDMKMMSVAHTNHICKIQSDSTFTVEGNKLTITNVNFVMASDTTKGHLWFFYNLKATVNGTTDVVKRLDITPAVMM